jgi:phosphoribosylamine--glycine ligase
VIIPRIKSDLFDLLEGVACRDLSQRSIEFDHRFATTVMLVSGGYPGSYEKGKEIYGLNDTDNCVVFHAGTTINHKKVVTAGGRVLAISSWGNTINEALAGSYRNAEKISFEGLYFRTDIGFDIKD